MHLFFVPSERHCEIYAFATAVNRVKYYCQIFETQRLTRKIKMKGGVKQI